MSIRRYAGLCLGALFLLALPSLAQTVAFVDANGSQVSTYLEKTQVRVRVEDSAANTYPWSAETVSVYLSASLSGDSETLTLTETGQDTGVFEGSMALGFEWSPYQPGVLETALQSGPPVVRDTLTAQYNSASDTAGMVAGRIELLDDLGRPAAGYTQGDLVRVRLEEHLRYNDPGIRDSVLVAVNVLAVSDEEFITLQETGNDTSLFEGSIPVALYATYDSDGVVGAPVGNQVHAQHSISTLDEWLDVYAPLVGSRAEILDGSGKATEFVAESSTIRLRAVDRTIGALTIADTLQVSVSSLLGADQETVTLTETGAQTGVYEAGLPTRFNIVDPTVLGNGRLETGEDAGPPHTFDTITLSYNGPAGASSDTATTYGSETLFIDEWGNDAEIYALGATVFVRVIDYNYDQSAARDVITAVVTGLTRGDNEDLAVTETGAHTGVFEGSLPIRFDYYYGSSYDGWLQAGPGETIEVRHTDAMGNTASADRAVMRYSDIHFFDAQGRPTNEVVEGGWASVRLYNFSGNTSTYSVDTDTVYVLSSLSGDSEPVTVTETGTNTGIFEGSIRLVFAPGAGGGIGGIGGNGLLETANSGSPDYTQDTLTASYYDSTATAATVGARIWLIDRYGQDAETFAAGDLVGLRVEDHNVDDPQARQTLQVVAVTNPETGDVESVNALETGYATGVFEGTVPSWLLPYFTANDGYLQVQANDRLEGRHVWLHSPRIAMDSAVIAGSSVLFVDGIGGGGQPVESYLEATTAYVRLVYAGGNVTPSADTVPVTVSTAISLDSETLTLTETGGNTGVFTGSIPIGNPGFVTPTPGNYVLETGRRTGPTELDTLTVTHTWYGGSASDTALMVNSRTWFVDAAGNPADEYARDSRAYIRVEDHILDRPDPYYDVAQVTLRSLSTGDQETFSLQETGLHTGLFAGSIELDSVINGTTYPYPGDGKLQSDAGEEIEVIHEEWGVVASSSDRAWIEYASVEWIDESGASTTELLEGGVARLRVFDPYGYYGGTTNVWVQSLYGDDSESVTLTETGYQSHIFEGTVQLRSVAPGGGVSSNGILETSTSGSPEYRSDEVTANYYGDQATAFTVPSRVVFIDGFGRAASSFAVTERAGVRVEDHNLDNPLTRGTVSVNVSVLSGETESVTLTETGYDTNLFEGSILLGPPYGGPGDGRLMVSAGDVIHAQHGNVTTPAQTTAEATVVGSRIQFEDAAGQPADVYMEGSRAWVRVVDSSAAGSISVTATLRTELGPDVETVWLTETAPSSGVFVGSIALGTGPAVVNDSVLTTVQYPGPPHEFDTLEVRYNADLSVMDTAATISSRTWFVDAAGNPADKYARESRAYVRVEDHVFDQPGVYDTVQVTLKSLTTGDVETLILQETARDGGVFAGSMALDSVISGTTFPFLGDGKLQSDTGEDIEVIHTDWTGATSSSDRARITYASVVFVDEAGQPTVDLLEGGLARLRVYDPYGSYGSTVNAGVQSRYSADYESVELTETAYQSHIYEGTVQLRSVSPGGGVTSNGLLETSSSGSPEYRADEVTAYYNGDQTVALTVPSRVWFIDGFGRVVSSFAVGETVGVRVVDINLDDPFVRRSIMVNVRSLAGDAESLTLTETGYDTNVYEGSIATQSGTPANGNGALQVQAGDVIEAEHVNQTTPNPTVAQATMTGASVLFVDADGQPAETFFEASRAWVRVVDASASGSVTATLRTTLGPDVETVTLTETTPATGVFLGSIALGTGAAAVNDNVLITVQAPGPPHEFDTLRAEYNGEVDTAATISSRTWFVDAYGNPADKYARESRAYVRVEDHTFDQPGIQDAVQVTLRSLTTGDQETITLQETALDGGIFAGSLPLDSVLAGTTFPNPGDGSLQSDTDEEIEAVHTDWTGNTSSSDRARITYASVEWVDEAGVTTWELLEGGVARLRVYDPYGGFGSTVNAGVQSRYGADYENVELTETAYQSRIYEGTVQLRSVAPGGGVPTNSTLETSTSGSPEYRVDEVTAFYNGDQMVAVTVPSRAWFLDLQGQAVTEYAVGSAVRVRVEDHNAGSAGQVDSVMVNLTTPADSENVTLTETGADTGIFEGSIDSGSAAGNGVLAAAPGVTVTAEHGNLTTPSPTRAQAVFSGNFAPLAVDDAAQTEEAPVTIPVLANDSDPDAEALQVASVTQGANGTVVINGDQTVTYTPAAAFLGTDTFNYVAADPRGGEAQATVTVTVLSANEPPTPAADDVTTPEDTALSIAVLANDTDPDNDPLEVIGSGFPSSGTAERQPDGTILYTPENNWSGQVSFTYMVRDPEGLTAYATVTVTVTPVNDPPVANDDEVTVEEDGSSFVHVTDNDNDIENDALLVTAVTQGANGVVALDAYGEVTYTPNANFNGTDSFTYTVSDGGGTDTATVTVTVTPANDAPAAEDDTATTDEDTPVTIAVLANDSDPDGDVLDVTYTTGVTNGAAVVNADNTVTFTPEPEYSGTVLFSYAYTDGTVTGYADVTVTIESVNDAPVAVDDSTEVAEDSSATVWVLTNDSDVEGDTLDVTAVTQGTNGAVVLNADDTVTYTPAADFHGSDSFTYTVVDGNGGTDTATVAVTVVPANDAPVAADDTATTPEDTPVTVSVLANDSDLDGDTLAVSAVTQGTNGAVAIAGAQVTYTPAADFHGTDSFTYTASDGNGGTGGATVTVTVTPVNDAPVAGDDTASVVEDGSVSISVRSNDTDVDGDTLAITVVTQGAHGSVTHNGGTVTYTPAANYNGPDSFTYTVSDGNGGSATGTVTMTVTGTNDAPVAVADAASLAEDGSAAVSVLANDSDLDGDLLSVTGVTQGAHGSVSISDSQAVYTPAANYNGSDSFTYTISDGHGGTATASVAITVTAVNDPPVAVNDTATTLAEVPVTIPVRANDTDIDSPALTVTAVTQGAHGTVSITSETGVTYTPATAWIGPDSFTYTISDGAGGTATATVNVTVQAPPRVTGNLQVLYTFNEGSGATVNDVSGVGTPLNLTIGNLQRVTWLPGALSLNNSVLLQTAGNATKVINACKASNEVTMEAWVAPDNTTQTGPAVIASIAQNTSNRDVTFGQSATGYSGIIRTSTTTNSGAQLNATGTATLNLTHVVYIRSAGTVKIYVNGTQVATTTRTGDFSNWANYKLALGGEPSGTRYWLGDMHLVAIYSRALTAAEVRQNWLSGAN